MSPLTITVGLIADLKDQPLLLLQSGPGQERGPPPVHLPRPWPKPCKPYPASGHITVPDRVPFESGAGLVSTFAIAPGTRHDQLPVDLIGGSTSTSATACAMEHCVRPDFTLQTGVGSCRYFAGYWCRAASEMVLAASSCLGYLVSSWLQTPRSTDRRARPPAFTRICTPWAEVYIPLRLDRLGPDVRRFRRRGPHSRCPPESRKRGSHYRATPILAKAVLDFSNTVTRIPRSPRVTLPSADEAWRTIQTSRAGSTRY